MKRDKRCSSGKMKRKSTLPELGGWSVSHPTLTSGAEQHKPILREPIGHRKRRYILMTDQSGRLGPQERRRARAVHKPAVEEACSD
eukprot:6121760-Pyramimonas_sp.AAC.1